MRKNQLKGERSNNTRADIEYFTNMYLQMWVQLKNNVSYKSSMAKLLSRNDLHLESLWIEK